MMLCSSAAACGYVRAPPHAATFQGPRMLPCSRVARSRSSLVSRNPIMLTYIFTLLYLLYLLYLLTRWIFKVYGKYVPLREERRATSNRAPSHRSPVSSRRSAIVGRRAAIGARRTSDGDRRSLFMSRLLVPWALCHGPWAMGHELAQCCYVPGPPHAAMFQGRS